MDGLIDRQIDRWIDTSGTYFSTYTNADANRCEKSQGFVIYLPRVKTTPDAWFLLSQNPAGLDL